MRLRALLAALSVLAVAVTGCPTASPPDEECIVGGGVCFRSDDPAGCYEPLGLACGTGFTCCTMAYGGNIGLDGALIDASTGVPSVDATVDSGVEASTTDAAEDSGHPVEAATHADGSHVDGSHPVDGATPKDGETPKG